MITKKNFKINKFIESVVSLFFLLCKRVGKKHSQNAQPIFPPSRPQNSVSIKVSMGCESAWEVYHKGFCLLSCLGGDPRIPIRICSPPECALRWAYQTPLELYCKMKWWRTVSRAYICPSFTPLFSGSSWRFTGHAKVGTIGFLFSSNSSYYGDLTPF